MVQLTDGVLPLVTGHGGVSSSGNNSIPRTSHETSETVSHFTSTADQQLLPQPSNSEDPSATSDSLVLNATSVAANDMLLRVITLNCWGLRFISRHRQQRIKSIAQHLKEQEYDIVFLQELWCQSDFEHIRSTTSYKFAHYFKTSSVVGTSGLAIFAKWAPETIHFEPYSVNGSPFMPHHGDWFAGKGVAYVRIEVGDLRMHLFCTHMHAQYDDVEQMSDMYSVHRICQAFQLSKFINLVAENTSHTKYGSDLIILAGDLNTTPGELPFKLLMSMTGLVDCAMHRYSHDVRLSLRGGLQDVTIDEDLITCGHHLNSYTVTTSRSTRTTSAIDRDQMSKCTGKRIDFILYKLTQSCSRCQLRDCSCNKSHFCFGTRVECLGKDPSTGLSFSDHQPVSVRLVIKKDSTVNKLDSGDSRCVNLKDRAMRAISSRLTYRNGTLSSEPSDSHSEDPLIAFRTTTTTTTTSHRSVSTDSGPAAGSAVNGTISNGKSQRSKSTSDQSVQTTTCNSASNFLTDYFAVPCKNNKIINMSNSSERQNCSSNGLTSTTISSSKVEFKPETAVVGLEEPSVQHLQSTYRLLLNYLEDNRITKQKFYFILFFLVISLFAFTWLAQSSFQLSIAVMFHLWMFIAIAALVILLLVELANRYERTALKGILEEVACILSFAPSASIVN